MHREAVRHRERLERGHGNGEVVLPLGEPEDEEEEATDKAEDDAGLADARPGIADVAQQGRIAWGDVKDAADVAEARVMQAEVSSKIRRRKAKAAAEEVADG